MPVIADVPYIATFLANSFDDATEDLVKAVCLYATFSSGRLLATWVQFGVVPTEFHRQRADPLWCTSAGALTAALMYPRCDVIGDKAGDYAQAAQNIIRVRFGLPPKVVTLHRKIKYSNMYRAYTNTLLVVNPQSFDRLRVVLAEYSPESPIGVPPA